MAKKINEVVIVDADDWQGLYVNGKLQYENHEIRPDEILKILGINYRIIECDSNWIENQGGRLPKNLEMVKSRK